jgi:hypothetical protein
MHPRLRGGTWGDDERLPIWRPDRGVHAAAAVVPARGGSGGAAAQVFVEARCDFHEIAGPVAVVELGG